MNSVCACVCDAGANSLDLIDHVLNQALTYLDHYDQSNGVSIHLVKGLIKIDGWNHKINGQHEPKSFREGDSWMVATIIKLGPWGQENLKDNHALSSLL